MCLWQICLAVVSSDYNPNLYLELGQVFLQRYLSTGSPVPMLEIYLEVLMRGHCTLDDSRTLNVKDFNVAQYVIKEAKVKGEFDNVSLISVDVFCATYFEVEWKFGSFLGTGIVLFHMGSRMGFRMGSRFAVRMCYRSMPVGV